MTKGDEWKKYCIACAADGEIFAEYRIGACPRLSRQKRYPFQTVSAFVFNHEQSRSEFVILWQ